MKACTIIAEAGVNHNGQIKVALQLVEEAAKAGADYIKFQSFKSDQLASKSASKASYQREYTAPNESQLEMLKRLELSAEDHRRIVDHCNSNGIGFLSSAFDIESLEFLLDLGIDYIKIPSGELTNSPFLEKVATKKTPLLISTGMSNLNDIELAMEVLLENGANRSSMTLLHCNTQYPTPFADVNLRAMNTLGIAFDTAVGYSDHTRGIEVPIAAVTLGATCIEKHFTLERKMSGPDHQASLEPQELANMVSSIRNIEIALGSSRKFPSASEISNRSIARRSIHLAFSLSKGTILDNTHLQMLRPGDGISPMEKDLFIGRRLLVDKNEGEMLYTKDIE